jgi:hypothetical protein
MSCAGNRTQKPAIRPDAAACDGIRYRAAIAAAVSPAEAGAVCMPGLREDNNAGEIHARLLARHAVSASTRPGATRRRSAKSAASAPVIHTSCHGVAAPSRIVDSAPQGTAAQRRQNRRRVSR